MEPTRVALLGTLSDLHQEPIQYDLAELRRIVKRVNPDLLLAEITKTDWEKNVRDSLPIEYRDCLVPLGEETDVVIVPIKSEIGEELTLPRGRILINLRTAMVAMMNGVLLMIQRLASRPEIINSGTFGHLCDATCMTISLLCGKEAREAWDEANRGILRNIIETVERDPGRRILVTLDCRRRHVLQDKLKRVPYIRLVDFRSL